MFSEFSGTILLVGAGILEETLGVDAWLLVLIGASLIGYGALLWLLGRRPDIRAGARLATIMDIGWVVATAVILIGFPSAMTTAGRIALLIVSLIVAGFAVDQTIGLRRRQADRAIAVRV